MRLDLPESSSLPRWQQLLQFFELLLLLLLSVYTKTTPSIVVVHFTNTLFCCCCYFGLSQNQFSKWFFRCFGTSTFVHFSFFKKFLQWIIKKFTCRKVSHLDLSYSALFHFKFFWSFCHRNGVKVEDLPNIFSRRFPYLKVITFSYIDATKCQ